MLQAFGCDFFATFQTFAIFPVGDAFKRGFGACGLCLAAAICGLGHSLLLHRVHAAEAANRLLVKCDGATAIAGGFILAAGFGNYSLKLLSVFNKIIFRYHGVH